MRTSFDQAFPHPAKPPDLHTRIDMLSDWPALLELVREDKPQRELKKKFEDVEFEEDILPELRKLEATHQEIAEAVGVHRTFVGKILRGEQTPSLEYWDSFRQLTDQPS